ncbi:MAG TPA: type II toxin-antitoxin system VapC family toxin [Desulfocapsa sulfexigens]|nr:type II toxin-antitoxin system VapC family toxin [Desulfocapsa sulfexigens]HIQ36403.1 type II toxin-antitoxin system VapC family toxin [Desulfocapsa sulfexigens]
MRIFRYSEEAALTKFLQPLNIVRLNHDSARKAAGIRAMLEKKGTPIASSDLLIPRIALSHNLILVTNNVREFRRVAGLTIENWI